MHALRFSLDRPRAVMAGCGLVAGLAVAILLWLAAAPATAADEPAVVPAGVTAGGVEIGGLTAAAAAQRLRSELDPKLQRRLLVAVGRKRFRLEPGEVGARFDATDTVDAALGADPGARVPLAVVVDRDRIAAWVQRLADRTGTRARDARVRMTVRQMFLRPARPGRMIHRQRLSRSIAGVLANPKASRFLRARWRRVSPKVTTAELRRRYRTVLTIDRYTFKLRMFKGLRLRKTYGIAVGADGWSTPPGRFAIQSKIVNPPWYKPAWAGGPGVVPGGSPANPLKARWLGVVGAVGIHGTADVGSIGSRASHGCIRMRIGDVIELYRWTPIGTPVLIR